MKRYYLIALVIASYVFQPMVSVRAQNDVERLSVSFYKNRRDELRKMMPPNSVFVLFSAPERTFSEDVDYVYHQNPDMFYFTGWTMPNSMMYIFSDEQTIPGMGSAVREVLFVPARSESEAVFLGKIPAPEEVMKDYGIQLALNTTEYENFPLDLSKFGLIITDKLPTDVREGASYSLSEMLASFRKKAGIKSNPDELTLILSSIFEAMHNDAQISSFISEIKRYTSQSGVKVGPLLDGLLNATDSVSRSLARERLLTDLNGFVLFERFTAMLRTVKTGEEKDALKKAIAITCAAHCEVMKAVNPGMSEREIQGIHEFVYRLNGSKENGFPLIIASGNNGCILHYQENSAPNVGNNLVLMDVGAMYCGYSADVTRTIPANGRFSPEQLAIYNIVLEAQDSAFSYCRQGMSFGSIELPPRKVIADGLMKLGIIQEPGQAEIYYPHSVSHSIGLDVHDKMVRQGSLSNGMIITLEPGIYIPVGSNCDKKWWGIAVRIEDDILINGDNPENLSLAAPRKARDIEKLMKKKSPVNKL